MAQPELLGLAHRSNSRFDRCSTAGPAANENVAGCFIDGYFNEAAFLLRREPHTGTEHGEEAVLNALANVVPYACLVELRQVRRK